MSAIDYMDTSAILNGAPLKGAFISRTVIAELEEIKNSSNKDGDLKAAARKASRELFALQDDITTPFYSQKEIDKVWRKFSWLPHNNDGIILAEAYLTQQKTGTNVVVGTADYNMYLAAKQMGLYTKWWAKDCEVAKEPWTGWQDFHLTDENMASLYSNPSFNILGAKVNEYCKIYSAGESKLKDVLRWDGEKYCQLKYRDIKNPYTQETIRPRNLEQKMAFDMLQNDNIRVKTIHSRWGGGKTLLALNYALEQIAKGRYQKIMYIRNNIVAADTNDIGFLPGYLEDKTFLWGLPLASHVGGLETLRQLIDDRVIEVFPLSHLRGVSAKSTIMIADECENFTEKHFTLMMSRIEDDSEIIFCGDMAQVDFKQGAKHSGMIHTINALAGDPLFGAVKLVKSERGPVPTLCDKIISPI